jgi:putative hydrolase of the HAD superfamily
MKPEVIFFDVGGTLVRLRRSVGEIYASLGKNYGQNWDPVALQGGFKAAWKELRPRAVGSIPSNGDDRIWWRQVVHRALAEVEISETFPHDTYFQELYERFGDWVRWRTYPEVFPVLDGLKAKGYRLAIISNWDQRLVGMLEGMDLAPYFEKMFISAQLGFEKPQPEIYRMACDAMGVEPRKAWMVGDDQMNDDEAPRQAGLASYLVERPGRDLSGLLDVL